VALDRFSHAYTNFLNEEFDVGVHSLLPMISDNEKGFGPYWIELQAALDVKAPNSARTRHATNAVEKYKTNVVEMMDEFSAGIDRLDGKVLELVEAANAIRDGESRQKAVEISRKAREIQAAYASIRLRQIEGFDNRGKVLEDIIERGGVINYIQLKYGVDKIAAAMKKLEEEKAVVASATSDLKDGFSALAGSANLTKYRSRYDDQP